VSDEIEFAGDQELASGLGLPAKPLPAYPRLGGSSSNVKIQNDWTARSWTGTPERLVQIQNHVLDALEKAYDDAVKHLSQDDEGRYEASELGQVLALRVTASGNGGRMTRTGELSTIFAEVDLSDVDEVQMTNGHAGPASINLSFVKRPKSGSVSVKLKVSGSDRSWVGGTHQLISSEVAKGVPRWAVLRHGAVSAMLGFVVGLGISLALVAFNAKDPGPNDYLTAVLIALALGSVVGGTVIWVIMQTLFPGFELVSPGSSNAGRRTLGALFAAANFAVGVVGTVLAIVKS
jgi:hypothetical protein